MRIPSLGRLRAWNSATSSLACVSSPAGIHELLASCSLSSGRSIVCSCNFLWDMVQGLCLFCNVLLLLQRFLEGVAQNWVHVLVFHGRVSVMSCGILGEPSWSQVVAICNL